jgi:MFS family permease
MRSAIGAQCFGMITQQMISGGILLLYMNAMGVKPSVILVILNLTPFISSFLSIPMSIGADSVGIKKFGTSGNILMITGVFCLTITGSLQAHVSAHTTLTLIITGLVIHTIGSVLFNTGWFSLLSHFVPSELTGRYFGLLRFSWQLVSLAFYAVSSLFFSPRTPLWVYQFVFAIGGVSVACRYLFYRKLPEAPRIDRKLVTVKKSLQSVTALPGFIPYCCYLLLLICVTSNGQDLLRLSAVKGCFLGDNQILFLTVSSMLGSLAGFRLMGSLIDKYGADRVFIICHIGFSLALVSFPLRTFLHLSPLIAGIVTAFLLGYFTSTNGLCTTTQSFRICSGPQRTLAYAIISTVQSSGSSLSGFALAGFIAGLERNFFIKNPFDIVLTGLSGFILLQVIALILVRRPP